MPLSPVPSIAAAQLAAIQAIGVTAGTPVTNGQLLQVLEALDNPVYTDLKTNAGVKPGTFEAPPGGTYPGGAITGDGGPLE